MQYKNIHPKINEYDNYRLYLAAQSLIDRYVSPAPFLITHLEEYTRRDLLSDLNNIDGELYVIYNSYVAELMKRLGEPISNRLLYAIWLRSYKNATILEDLVFQKIEAHTNHNIPLEEMKNACTI